MAIPFLNHLDLRSVSELQNAILHKTTSGSASDIEGKIIYDTGTDTIKYYSGASGSGSWVSLTGDTNTWRPVTAGGNTLGSSETLAFTAGTNITITETGGAVTINAGAATTVGKTSGSQRSGEIEIIAGSNVSITEDGTTGHFTFAATDTNTNQLTTFTIRDDDDDAKVVEHGKFIKFVSATGTAGTNWSGSGTTGDPWVMTITNPDTTYSEATGSSEGLMSTAHHDKLDGIEASADVTDKTNVKAALALLDSTDTTYIGDADDDTTVIIRGTLQVDGTTTTVNSETLTVDDNKIVLNSNSANTPTEDAGIEIERGNSTNVELRWNEGHDDWEFQAYNHAGSPALTTYKIPTTYTTTIGDASATAIAVTHNLGTRNVIVQLYDSSSYETVYADAVRTDTNTVTLTFASAPASNDVTVLISKVG